MRENFSKEIAFRGERVNGGGLDFLFPRHTERDLIAGPYLTLFSSSGFASAGRRPLFRNARVRPPVPAYPFCPSRALWPRPRRGRSCSASGGRQEITARFPSRVSLSFLDGKKENSKFLNASSTSSLLLIFFAPRILICISMQVFLNKL